MNGTSTNGEGEETTIKLTFPKKWIAMFTSAGIVFTGWQGVTLKDAQGQIVKMEKRLGRIEAALHIKAVKETEEQE